VLQSTWGQLVNFACEYPEDEKLLMDTFKQQNMRSSVVTIRPGAAVPAGDAARYKEYGVLCTLDEVRCVCAATCDSSCQRGTAVRMVLHDNQ
jgi:hypothetical protein